MLAKLLIANRGEIAIRVARTAHRMGIPTIAVYSDADRSALHTRFCNEAVYIGAAPSTESYLVIDRILEAMESTGANAVHPGYGFLSENADFAESVEAEGWIFVGPTADTIRSMGSKASAKNLMEQAGVPTTPGYQGRDQSLETFREKCEQIGYPVLLKASAGGGGKGMRVVNSELELEDALNSAKRESQSAFGDDTILIEKYVRPARHVEVQIFGDGNGDVVHLYDRDCSIQRRHQKIIEEAPAFGLNSSLRNQLLEAGVNAGKAVNYRGAGTVEFLYDVNNDAVYFMEMNTRLQVEHPVTEMVTGVDLVEWQLRLASGEGIPLSQESIRCEGHSIEARVYAEDPYNDFVPSTGVLESLQLSPSVRNDCGVEAGQEISPYYDPMITKMVVHKPSRIEAIYGFRDALSETRIGGVETNLQFLSRVASGLAYFRGEVSTSYIDDHRSELLLYSAPSDVAIASAILHCNGFSFSVVADPWEYLQGFRLNDSAKVSTWLQNGKDSLLATVSLTERIHKVSLFSQSDATSRRRGETPECIREFEFSGTLEDSGGFSIEINGEKHKSSILKHKDGVKVFVKGENWNFSFPEMLESGGASEGIEGSLNSPMAGVVTSHIADIGQVQVGDPILTIEAMKMEHKIFAPSDGELLGFRFAVGQQVKEGEMLVDFE